MTIFFGFQPLQKGFVRGLIGEAVDVFEKFFKNKNGIMRKIFDKTFANVDFFVEKRFNAESERFGLAKVTIPPLEVGA